MSTILIVDDDVCLSFLLSEYLSTIGHRCIRVENVAGARAHLRTHQVDLVISDVNMPGESGFDLLRHVSSCYPQISLLLMSAMDDAESRRRAAQMGARGYLVKPFKFGNLRAQLTAMAEQSHHQRFPEQSQSPAV
ncbi:response regulator [Desulfoferrobacter suflitae]|uniref:response regulator n=1 Tax=Desulfoferrobacter suflitae TaxID=2865782 RepID=UPI002164D794|nr:response regulator [Desulfoferrobacter suflitae]MCK8603842.1 response regulator [Desulfoferrobacter suflitae]